jgi:hypothetical protein
MKICPHCGARLPVTHDAFCSECRQPLDEPRGQPIPADLSPSVWRERKQHASEYFTMPGRILVLTTIVLAAGGPWLVFLWLHDSLRPGRYPLWFFALPIWIGLVFLFALATAVLRWLGVSVLQQPEQSEGIDEEPDGLSEH